MNHHAVPLQALKPLWLALFAVFPALTAAQATAPNAGSILQQITPIQPAAPSATGTGLRVLEEGAASLPPSAPFPVKTIRIIGNKKIATETLHALVAEGEGKILTLAQLGELASRITSYYNSHGFPLARAIIPAQVIDSGVVKIQVIVARYDKVKLENRSRISDSLLQATLAPLQSGEDIEQSGLDRALLLLSDMPGVAITATLRPGEAAGTSDLLVDAVPGQAVSGSITLDNYGSRYAGRARLGGTVNFNDPLRHGDVLSLSALSAGSGMNYGRIGYESLVNGHGTRLGGSYSALRYELGGPVASLDADGTARVASLWAKHPFIRSRNLNLYGQIQYDRMKLRDHVNVSGIHTDRHLDKMRMNLSGDARDGLLSGGVNLWNVGWTAGRVGFDNALAQASDAATAKTDGGFSKWNANLARLQRVADKSTLYLAFSGQWANDNLDSAEKLSVGGPYSVRAYDVGVVSGDDGYQATVELRHDLGQALQGQWQALAFFDSAHVTINRRVWGAGTNSATLSGAGVGLSWLGPQGVSAKAYVATPVGAMPTLVGTTNSVRAWMEIGKEF